MNVESETSASRRKKTDVVRRPPIGAHTIRERGVGWVVDHGDGFVSATETGGLRIYPDTRPGEAWMTPEGHIALLLDGGA